MAGQYRGDDVMFDGDGADRFIVVGEIFEPEGGGARGIGGGGLNSDGGVPWDIEVDVVIGEEGSFGLFALAVCAEDLEDEGLGFSSGALAGDSEGPAWAGGFTIPAGREGADGAGVGDGANQEAGFDGEGRVLLIRLIGIAGLCGEACEESGFRLILFNKQCLTVACGESAERNIAGLLLRLFCRCSGDGRIKEVPCFVKFGRQRGASESRQPELVDECLRVGRLSRFGL